MKPEDLLSRKLFLGALGILVFLHFAGALTDATLIGCVLVMVFDIARMKSASDLIPLGKAKLLAKKHIMKEFGLKEQQIGKGIEGMLIHEITMDGIREYFYAIKVHIEPDLARHVKVHATRGDILADPKVSDDLFSVADVPDVVVPVPTRGVKEAELEESEEIE